MLNNYRNYIFYVITITVIISSGNLLSVAHFLHHSIARAEGSGQHPTTRYQSIEAIVYNHHPWVHYVGNTLSIITALMLLFVVTPKVHLNMRYRIVIIPYAICSLTMIVVPEYIVFKTVLASGNIYNDDVFKTGMRSVPLTHALTQPNISNNDTSTERIFTGDSQSNSVLPTRRNRVATTSYNCKDSKVVIAQNSSKLNKNNDNNDKIQNKPLSGRSRRERVSCFVIYQMWVALRVVFCLLVCRYLYFLQWSIVTRRSPPKRANATRRGVIDIRITEDSPMV